MVRVNRFRSVGSREAHRATRNAEPESRPKLLGDYCFATLSFACRSDLARHALACSDRGLRSRAADGWTAVVPEAFFLLARVDRGTVAFKGVDEGCVAAISLLDGRSRLPLISASAFAVDGSDRGGWFVISAGLTAALDLFVARRLRALR